MRLWTIEFWDSLKRQWRPVDSAHSRRHGETVLVSYAGSGYGRYRLVNPRGTVVLHRGIVKFPTPLENRS